MLVNVVVEKEGKSDSVGDSYVMMERIVSVGGEEW